MNLTQINTLHELLDVAILDFQKILLDRRYTPNMNVWHDPQGDYDEHGKWLGETCHVCLAGSVMAMSLLTEPDRDDEPCNHPDEIDYRLEALNELRLGYIEDAAISLHRAQHGWAEPEDVVLPSEIYPLIEKWEDRIPRPISEASDHGTAMELLKYLKEMHLDLRAAGI